MTRVAVPKPESVDDPLIEEIFAWVTKMEGEVPNHFYVVGASLFLAWIGPCGRVGGIVVSAFPPA